ncbi:MAG: hypothetical protein U0232_08855 [Thermomicrobiales bacterium]
MAAQSVALGRNYAPAFIWRGLLVLRAMGVGMMAGMVAGFVAGGVGSRLAMKAVALVAGADARGRITENGSTIGDFTADGTIFLLLFGTALGTVGGLLYMTLHPWLARAGRWRGLAFGAVLLATIRAGTLDAENFDFTRFGIPAVNVALFAALPLAFGLIVAPCADWLDRRVPTPAHERVALLGPSGGLGLLALAVLPLGFLLLLAGIGAGLAPLLLAALLAALGGYVALGVRLFPAGEVRRIPRLSGYLLTIALGVLGFAPLVSLFAGLVLNGDERGETRLGGAMLTLLFLGGIAARLWPSRDGNAAARRWLPLLLAVPVLVGLGVTLREIGAIVAR